MDQKFSVTMDAADPLALGEFWAVALGYVREPPPAPHQTWDEALTAWGLPPERWNDANAIIDPDGLGPRIFIQKVPEPKTAKNRVHLDVRVSTSRENKDMAALQAKADLLVAAGATQGEVFDDEISGHWIVMRDPEGNEFCII
ncbi:MAG: VOC family protein [Propionicimonas sp.]|uniref:VOC family protein n=1 Tax=Propionicimonas sp. TaxID=1955623 RepID=UPI002B2032D7|nr:VOC family protein [Propionicimonas sp.]MEA4944786.1 VOC family protein [Propionicimonas sp.]MEA5052430.1 VOC family protein [Propionicimonas sp.]